MAPAPEVQSDDLAGPWDLVVVGHGAAGLSAAVSFLQACDGRPVRVAVLDRASAARRGGSTAWTTAAFRLDTDGQLCKDWADHLRRTAGHAINEGYIKNFYEHAVDTLNWIRLNGVRTVIHRNVMPPGSFGPHAYALEGGGRAFVEVFSSIVDSLGARCFYGVDLLDVLRGPAGPATGVRVRAADGGVHEMSARAVVLACGGFEGDRGELGRRLRGGETLDTVAVGSRVNTGRGIDAAIRIGAATAGQYDGAHLEPVDPRCPDPEPLIMTWNWGILVDPQGQRFVNESEFGMDLQFDNVAKAILGCGGRAYAITDASSKVDNPYMASAAATSLPPVCADSIEELADKLSIPVARLRETVEKFNAATGDRSYDPRILDEKCTVGLTPDKSHWANPLTRPPFEAYPVGVQICFTFWGLKVDDTTHVLDVDGMPIPGLHAAGEIVGIFYQDTYPAATSVLRSLTFGRLAGLQIAEELAAARGGVPSS